MNHEKGIELLEQNRAYVGVSQFKHVVSFHIVLCWHTVTRCGHLESPQQVESSRTRRHFGELPGWFGTSLGRCRHVSLFGTVQVWPLLVVDHRVLL